MLRLVKSELTKLFSYKTLYVFWAAVLAVPLVTCIGIASLEPQAPQDQLANLPQLSAMGISLPIATLQGISTFILPLMIIILAGFMISEEHNKGTLQLFLIQPVSRASFILAKMVALSTTTLLTMLFGLVMSVIFGTLFFGFGDQFVAVNDVNGVLTENVLGGMMITLQSYTLLFLIMVAFSSLMILLAFQFTSGGAMIGAGVGVLVLLNILINMPGGINDYFISGYLHFHEIVMFAPEKISMGLGVAVAYTVFGYVVSYLQFKRRDILS